MESVCKTNLYSCTKKHIKVQLLKNNTGEVVDFTTNNAFRFIFVLLQRLPEPVLSEGIFLRRKQISPEILLIDTNPFYRVEPVEMHLLVIFNHALKRDLEGDL